MSSEDLQNQVVEVWAQHWQAVDLFCQMATQWRVGLGGAVGLDYGVLLALMNLQQIEKPEQLDILAQIQVMETAALGIFNESKT